MNCDCENAYDYDCQNEECVDERRKVRTALFDFMKCQEIEAFEGWNEEEGNETAG